MSEPKHGPGENPAGHGHSHPSHRHEGGADRPRSAAHGGHGHAPHHGHAEHAREHPHHLPKVKRRSLVLAAILFGGALILFFLIGFIVHHSRLEKRKKMAEQMRDRPPAVLVAHPGQTQKSFGLSLPADVRPWASTALYARTSGFLAAWNFDINDRIKKGDVLAVISAPDTDAELEQAAAELNQQRTNHRLAELTENRYQGLVPVQGVTEQQLDQFRTNREQAAAGVVSAQANMARLKALVGFEKIIAPYDGIVTTRTYDVGALISSSNIQQGQELFDVEEDDRLRVFVNVPQAYVQLIKFGQPVTLVLDRNFPGHKFQGVVSRSSWSIDLQTRTLRTELDFSNTDAQHLLIPGMYAQAVFQIQRSQPVLTIPTSALLFEQEGREVALVQQGNKVHLQKIVPGSDFGAEMEVLSGLKADDRIIVNPGEQIAEGLVVAPTTREQQEQQQKQQQQQKQAGDKKGKKDSDKGGA